ncbi:hypothetical protein H5410_064640, partial [Solanum commersonii]
VLGDALDTWEARQRGQDTAPSSRGTSRALCLTKARQSAREGALVGSRPPSRTVVWTTVHEGVVADALETWEVRPRVQDTSPSSRGASRAVCLTTARQNAHEAALVFRVS